MSGVAWLWCDGSACTVRKTFFALPMWRGEAREGQTVETFCFVCLGSRMTTARTHRARRRWPSKRGAAAEIAQVINFCPIALDRLCAHITMPVACGSACSVSLSSGLAGSLLSLSPIIRHTSLHSCFASLPGRAFPLCDHLHASSPSSSSSLQALIP